ncbi:MAG TPA: glycosyltransferase family A protein [Clostridia bacterium]|nr:glycosyltransferase family A protein [Clostridia bacterium]
MSALEQATSPRAERPRQAQKTTCRYVIVSPVRNEAEYLPLTIDSIANQSIRPMLWVIVNDGSTDETARLAQAAAEKHSWIRVIHRADRGFRQAGGGVVDAFYDGYRLVEKESWDTW